MYQACKIIFKIKCQDANVIAGQLVPWVKSACVNLAWFNSAWCIFRAFSYIYDIWFNLFCIIFWTKSQINIKQLLSNIAIKLLIDQIEGELATWLKVMAVFNLRPNKHGLVTYVQVNVYIGNKLWLNVGWAFKTDVCWRLNNPISVNCLLIFRFSSKSNANMLS